MIVFASHSKKRPNGLTVVRMFDHQVMEMVEFGVVRCLPSAAFYDDNDDEGENGKEKKAEEKDQLHRKVLRPAVGQRPVLLFQGDLWEVNDEYKRIKNMLMDLLKAG
jgi:ribosome production factor 2